jgi:hypothetical protein
MVCFVIMQEIMLCFRILILALGDPHEDYAGTTWRIETNSAFAAERSKTTKILS